MNPADLREEIAVELEAMEITVNELLVELFQRFSFRLTKTSLTRLILICRNYSIPT